MTESRSPEELIGRFKSQPVGFSDVELSQFVGTLREPSRRRGLVLGISVASFVTLSIASLMLLMPTAPHGSTFTPRSLRVPNSDVEALSSPTVLPIRPHVPGSLPVEATIAPIEPQLVQSVLLTEHEIADLGIQVTDSSIILNNGSTRSEYLRGSSHHRIGQVAQGSTSQSWIEPIAIVNEDGNLLQYRIPHVSPEQMPAPLDSTVGQFVEIRIDWDHPQRERLLRESNHSTDNADASMPERYVFMTKEQTDSFRTATRQQIIQVRTNIVDGIAAGKLIPLKVRISRTDALVRTPDLTFWYMPTDDFLRKLPLGYATAILNELRGNGGKCSYTTSCIENGATLQLVKMLFDPASELISVEFRSIKPQPIVFTLYNTIGVPLGSVTHEAAEGMNSLHIPVAHGNHGLIFLSARSSSGEHVASRVFLGPR